MLQEILSHRAAFRARNREAYRIASAVSPRYAAVMCRVVPWFLPFLAGVLLAAIYFNAARGNIVAHQVAENRHALRCAGLLPPPARPPRLNRFLGIPAPVTRPCPVMAEPLELPEEP